MTEQEKGQPGRRTVASPMADRKVVVRETKETRIRCEIARGSGQATVETGMPFLDHMLVAFARYSGLDLVLTAAGDLPHHLLEDVAIVVGAAVAAALPATAARYGDRTIPMDEALVHCAIDLGGRPYYQGRLPSDLYTHWMRSFADNAKATLHLRVLRGTDRHHIVEAAFKALGLAVRDAFVDSGAVFSTKGGVALRVEDAK
jgi:imidazoleglycerol-phosphate dehydratase